MTADNSSEVFATYAVGLPVYTWSSTLLVICDRKVRLLEGTIVRLVNDGISDIDVIAGLLGLDDEAIVLRTVQQLIDRGVLSFAGGLPLHVTHVVGREMLDASLIKDERRLENVQIAYDPLRRTFCWAEGRGTYMSAKELKEGGSHLIRPPHPLSVDFLPQNFREVQTLVRSRPDKLREYPLGRDVVHFELQEILPARPTLRFLPGQLEVSHHRNGEWTYRVLRQDGEDVASTDTLRTWEAGGHEMLPSTDAPTPPSRPAVKALMAFLAPLSRPESFITDEVLQRQEMRQFIQEASRSLLIAPATGTGLLTDDIAGWLDDALNNTSELKVLAGIEEGLSRARRPGPQLAALRALQKKYQGRVDLLELAAAPCRIAVRDSARIIIQTTEARAYSDLKVFQREVLVPPADATTSVSQDILAALKDLFIKQ